MRTLPILVLLALSLSAASAFAQTNETPTEGNETAPTEGNETAETNATAEGDGAANETPEEEQAPAGPIEITMTAHAEGSDFWFEVEGQSGRNPALTFPPGAEVVISLTSMSGLHNIQVTGFDASDYVDKGESVTYTFTAPETGTLEYWCVPHKAAGMKGTIRIGTPPAAGEQPATGAEEIQGGIDLGQFDPACAGVMIPAIATRDVVGGPTLNDYIERCKSGEVVTAGDESHPADLVIPISWALIGLGIAGVVWVHKYYKP